MRISIILYMFLTSLCNLRAQTVHTQALDEVFNAIEKREEGMGSISIFKDGRELYRRAFGYENIESSIPATTETRYRIGSVTKTFTAAIIMQLIEENTLDINSKLSEFFQEIPHSDQITIEDLLRHKSGLTDKKYLKWKYYGKSFALDRKPEYANVNYVLLAEIAEKLEHKPFADLLQNRIVNVCGLENTFYGYAKVSPVDHEASSYRIAGDVTLVEPSDLIKPHGAGGMISTPADVNRFFHCLFSGMLISETTLQNMQKSDGGYGAGLMKFPYKNMQVIGHKGQIDGFDSTILYFPDSGLSVCYLSNCVVMPVNDILIDVLEICFRD